LMVAHETKNPGDIDLDMPLNRLNRFIMPQWAAFVYAPYELVCAYKLS